MPHSEKRQRLKYQRMFYVRFAVEPVRNPELILPIVRIVKDQAKLLAHKDFSLSALLAVSVTGKENLYPILAKDAEESGG